MLLGLLCVLTTAPPGPAARICSAASASRPSPDSSKVDQAFALESEQQGDRLLLRIRIADGYYLYRHSIRVKGENLAFDEPVLPPAPSTRMTSSARAGSITRRCRSPWR